MVAIAMMAPCQQKGNVASTGRQIVLQGSLPGEGVQKGQAVSIEVMADDGSHSKPIKLTKKIGEGGEGSVFETSLGKTSDYVAKIYARSKLIDTKIEKLKLMMSKSIALRGVCFPVAIIKNEKKEPVGFLMPRAKGVELGKSVFMPKLLQQKFPSWTRRDTIQLCITILEKIEHLNNRGIILGDINGQNILVVSPTEVYFVDCDSYQIGNYPCPAGTVHFTPPEAQGKDYSTFLRTQAMENFAIATLLFMIMLPGKSPYASVGGASPAENIRNGAFVYESNDNSKVPPGKWGFIWSHMSFKTREAFVETFRRGGEHFAPEKRMNAKQWLEIFKAYQHGIDHMLARDPMAMDIFPTRPKMRECRQCGKMYVPDPFHYMPICPECAGSKRAGAWGKPSYNTARDMQIEAAYSAKREMDRIQRERERAVRRVEENQRNVEHRRWLNEVWKRYPCKNPKCHNTITLYNRDQARYVGNKRLPEYCNDCRQDTPCKKCGYVAAKWMHDERDGLCKKCYEEEKRKSATALTSSIKYQQKNVQQSVSTTAKPRVSNSTSNNSGDKPDGCMILLIIFLIFMSPLTWAILSSCSSSF